MFPLVNISMLAPLIVGFALEQVEIDSMGTLFEELVKDGRQRGMSEAELASGLHSVMRDTKTYSVTSTPVYTEPNDADQRVSIWANAKDIQSARLEHKKRRVC
jgi:hypothetical protein